jgi:hypothetical protein
MSDDACALEARACVPCPGKSPARITFTGSRAILVVEDDALCRIMLADHLRSIGYQVVEAANAEEQSGRCRHARRLTWSSVTLSCREWGDLRWRYGFGATISPPRSCLRLAWDR